MIYLDILSKKTRHPFRKIQKKSSQIFFKLFCTVYTLKCTHEVEFSFRNLIPHPVVPYLSRAQIVDLSLFILCLFALQRAKLTLSLSLAEIIDRQTDM